MSKRQYSEREVGRMLRRATELQDADPTHHGPGLTLEEIEQIARESGIDPRYIRAAASDPFSSTAPERKFHWLGGPTYVESERILPGSLDDEKWATAIREVRRTFRASGLTEDVGSTREWSSGASMEGLAEARVSAAPRDDRTHVRVSQHYGGLVALVFFLSLVFTTFISAAVLKKSVDLAPLIEWMMYGGAMTLVTVLLRQWVGHSSAKASQVQSELLSRLDALVAGSPGGELEADASRDPSILLDLDEPDPEAEPAPRKRERS